MPCLMKIKINKCGTYAGYSQHYRDNTMICQPCRDAGNEYRRDHRNDKVRSTSAKWREKNIEKVRDINLRSGAKWRTNNPDKKRAFNRNWEIKNPGYFSKYYKNNKEKIKEYSKQYRESNPEKKKESARQDYIKNSERVKEASRKWAINNPEKTRELGRVSARKRRVLKLENRHEPYTEEAVLEHWGTDCNICLLPIDFEASRKVGVGDWEKGLHIDHLIPISKYGPDTLTNVRPTHALCNLKKGASL